MSVKHWGNGAETALMLHCTLAQGAAWAGVARHLRDQLSMIAPDLLCHGDGPAHDPARDFHDQATEAAATHLPDDPSHLIGHSFGATIALRLALDAPHRVKSLTLIEPVLFCASNGPGRVAQDVCTSTMSTAIEKGDLAQAARIFLNLWGAEPFDALAPALQDYIKSRIWIPDACAPALVQDRAQILPRLEHLQTPTLILRGDASPPVIAEITAHLLQHLPDAGAQTVTGAGHMAPLTHAPQISSAIATFTANT